MERECNDVIALWTAGGKGWCYDDVMGFLVGGENGYKYALMEVGTI